MFTVLDGEIEVTFRGAKSRAPRWRNGQHSRQRPAPISATPLDDLPARLLCLCAPAGQDEFFILVGQPVATRTEAPPTLDADAWAAFIARAQALAPDYKTELLPPPL